MPVPGGLELREERRGRRDDLVGWQRFADDVDGRFDPGWWDEPLSWQMYGGWFFSVRVDGLEVARVELDDDGVLAADYVGAPAVDGRSGGLEIVKLEVAPHRRGQGVGRATVLALGDRLADRRLVALSLAKAVPFWTSLGWERFDRVEAPPHSSPLFVQPAPDSW